MEAWGRETLGEGDGVTGIQTTAGFKSGRERRGLGEERWEWTRGHSSSYGFMLVVDGRKGSSLIAHQLDKTERPPVHLGVDNTAGKQQGFNTHVHTGSNSNYTSWGVICDFKI